MKSLRSRMILASVLWTAGLLMLMHMVSLLFVHFFPRMRGAHSVFAIGVAAALMLAGFVVARRGLTLFADLRAKLAAVHSGRERRVTGVHPAEVQPLIDDLNALLDERERAVQRAFTTAGDLAHGLKTPLALLAHEAAQSGDVNVAAQVERMTRQVNYHLARARAAASGASGATPCPIEPCAAVLVRTLATLHASRQLRIAAQVAPGAVVRVQREDLEEILGNLLDNACKWARSKVQLTAQTTGAQLTVTVDDDGPGLAPELRARALQRGVRLDEAAPGSGLGLAIVCDLAELYGGAIALEDSPLGGLRARVTLPAVQ